MIFSGLYQLPVFVSQGNEVPDWFEYSTIGSSLQVSTNCCRRLCPLGFIFSLVLVFPNDFDGSEKRLKVRCECLTRSGENFYSTFFNFNSKTTLFHTEHTFLWCEHLGASQFYSDGAMFQFSAKMKLWGKDMGGRVVLDDDSDGDSEIRMFAVDGAVILKCGVTLIGRKDGNSAVAGERASLFKGSQKRKRGDDEEDEPPSCKR